MNQQLVTYLNDHLGGARAGEALAKRLEAAAKEEYESAQLDGLTTQIVQDIETLCSAIHAVGGSSSPSKQASGWLAEKAHRVAVAVDTATGRPELARLLEAESLSLGIEGKRCLWMALLEIADAYPALAAMDLQRLADRAQEQRRRIESLRLTLARRAFTPDERSLE